MMFFAAFADFPSPPPRPPAVVIGVQRQAPPAGQLQASSAQASCPVGAFALDGRPCPHPAFYGLAQHSDVPGQTLGSTDPAYGAGLAAQVCEAKPWTC